MKIGEREGLFKSLQIIALKAKEATREPTPILQDKPPVREFNMGAPKITDEERVTILFQEWAHQFYRDREDYERVWKNKGFKHCIKLY